MTGGRVLSCDMSSLFIASAIENNITVYNTHNQLWDVSAKAILYNTGILGSSLITASTFLESQLITADSNGILKCFEFREKQLYHRAQIDLEISLTEDFIKEDTGNCFNILSLHHVQTQERPATAPPLCTRTTNDIRNLLNSKDWLICSLPGHFVFLDIRSMEFQKMIKYSDIDKNLPSIIEYSTFFGKSPYSVVTCLIKGLLDCQLYYIRIAIDDEIKSQSLNFIAKDSLIPNSPLRLQLKQTAKKKDPSEKPLTFKTKVKSSGYGVCEPKRELFHPITERKKKSSTSKAQCDFKPLLNENYSQNSGYPTQMISKSADLGTTVFVNSLKFSKNGKNLAAACSDNSVRIFKTPLSEKSKDWLFLHHTSAVQNIHWSNCGKYLVSNAQDKKVCLISPNNQTPILKLNFDQEVSGSQFFYIDRFIMVSLKRTLELFSYVIDLEKTDIKRYEEKSRAKTAFSYTIKNIQNITSIAAPNSYHSHLCLCSCSDKSIRVFDLNEGKEACRLESSRIIHDLSVNEGSSGLTLSADLFNLFVSSAVNEGVKIWDLRSGRCIRKFDAHKCSTLPCKAELSPCTRYIGSGSEDGSVYVYDVASGGVLSKLEMKRGVVNPVTFNLAEPMVNYEIIP
ncbi:DgyrCDS6009 [Dimorphilus gyrociliatus]|uniref:DgyrCDS6009 n=1 Tax=Dimorphilus gyrociliatus TaxID=2664684 RepID=A0A7I8VLV0_9ANNE|nr:DgyrCDS6009 [Dimorphilus gyrociliatus]